MLELDHIAVLGTQLDSAVAAVEGQVGQPLLAGGQHAHFGTHNRLMGLGPDLYIEAIAIDPAAPPLPYARWFGLDAFDGPARLDKWICRVPDMGAALDRFPQAGVPVTLQRGELRWIMAVPEDGLLPFDGLFPALIQWHSPVPPGVSLPDDGLMLECLRVTHPQAQALEALLKPVLQSRLVRFENGPASLQAELSHAGRRLCLR